MSIAVTGPRSIWRHPTVSSFSILARAVNVTRDEEDFPAAIVASAAVLLSEQDSPRNKNWLNFGDTFAVNRLKFCNPSLKVISEEGAKEVSKLAASQELGFVHLTEETYQYLAMFRVCVGENGFVMVSDYQLPKVRELCDDVAVLTGAQQLYIVSKRGHCLINGLVG